MLARNRSLSSTGRIVVLATIAVLVVTIGEAPLAVAAPASKGVSAATASSDATDFSSARRRRHYYRGGDAAGLAFFGMALGTMAAIAAQQNYGYAYGPYYYGYGPYYYGGGPYYYGDGPYYGRRYYYRPY